MNWLFKKYFYVNKWYVEKSLENVLKNVNDGYLWVLRLWWYLSFHSFCLFICVCFKLCSKDIILMKLKFIKTSLTYLSDVQCNYSVDFKELLSFSQFSFSLRVNKIQTYTLFLHFLAQLTKPKSFLKKSI